MYGYLLLVFAAGSVISLALAAATYWLLPRLGLVDRPHLYGLKRDKVPYPFGVCAAVIFAVLVSIFFEWNKQMIGIGLGAGLLAVMGFIDDRYRLPALPRLFLQVVAAGIIVVFGLGVDTFANPLTGAIIDAGDIGKLQLWNFGSWSISLSPIADAMTLVWVLLFINAMNWLDGVEGNAPGVTLVGALVLAGVSLLPQVGQESTATVAVLLAATCVGVFAFNFPFPTTRTVLGDSGSMVLGFLLAALSIYYGAKIATTVLLFALPILDAIAVTLRRISQGKSPLKGDYSHLHHRLLRAGWQRWQVSLFFSGTSALLGAAALFLSSSDKLIVFLLVVGGFLVYLFWLERRLPDVVPGPF